MSKEDRFALLNKLSFNDKFFDNENEEYLDSLDVVKILNHYDNTLSEFVKREVEKQDKIADLETKLAESEKNFVVANNLRKNSDEILLNYKTEKYGLDKTIQELRKIKLSLPEKEWYYKGFENCERQMSSHIADLTLEVKELKQQLAECEKEKEYYQDLYFTSVKGQEKLKQQLDEKEKEVDNLYNRLNSKQKYYEMNLEKDYQEYLSRLTKLEKQCDKDKISFAVEQLEQIFSDFNKKVDDEFGDNDVRYITLDIEDVNFYLQDKIESIKEGK